MDNMPMDPVTLTQIVLGSLVSNGIIGTSAPQLASGLANGLSIYAQTGITVQSVDTGTLGAGIGTGTGIIVSPAITASMIAAFTANGIIGSIAIPLANAVAISFTQAFATALINTVSAGVGVGSGLVVLVPNPGVSSGIFFAGLTSAGLMGISKIQLATAVAAGLDQILPSCTGVVVIAGPPSISPGASVGVGKLS
jgi:hypothetical protein